MSTEKVVNKFSTLDSEEEEKDDSSIFDFKQEQAQGLTNPESDSCKPSNTPTTEQSPQVVPQRSQLEDFPLAVKDQESLSSGISSNNTNTPKKQNSQPDKRRFSSDQQQVNLAKSLGFEELDRRNTIDPHLRQSMQLPRHSGGGLHSSFVNPGMISIDDFTTRVRPADVKVEIIDFKKKYLGASEYVISIQIGSGWNVHCLSKKTYNEFQAFHAALTMKFKTAQFVKMPPASSIMSSKKAEDQQLESFQRMFSQILTYATQHSQLKRNLMSMLYRFVCGNAKPVQDSVLRQQRQQQAEAEETKQSYEPERIIPAGVPSEQFITPRAQNEQASHSKPINQQFEKLAAEHRADSEEQATPSRKRTATMDEGEKSANTSELRIDITKNESGKRQCDSDDDIIALKKHSIMSEDEFLSPLQTPDKREREKPSSLKLDIIESAQNNQERIQSTRQQASNKQGEVRQGMRQDIPLNMQHELREDGFGNAQVRVVQQPSALNSDLIYKNQQPRGKLPNELGGRMTREQVLDKCQEALSTMSENSLGDVYVLFPGKENWEKYYAYLRDSQLQFLHSIKNHSFRHSYIINRVVIRRKRKYMSSRGQEGGTQDLRKMDVLILTHQYDSLCLYITAPIIFQSKESYPEFSSIILQEMEQKIQEHALVDPTQTLGLSMDQTNRYAWGKIYVEINKLINFPYHGQIFIKLTLGPWVIGTRKIMDSKLEWNQSVYLPAPGHFFSLKIEILNLLSDGWFREHSRENIIDSFEIRIPDINKEPFQKNGSLVLPLRDKLQFKQLGLKRVEAGEGQQYIQPEGQPMLIMKVQDLTRLDASIVYNMG